MSLCHSSALEEIAGIDRGGLVTIDTLGLDNKTLTHLNECLEVHNFNRVEVLLHLMQSVIVASLDESILKIAPPILSRVFQTLSRGFVNLLNCKKITDTRFPFPFAQLISGLLACLMVLTPVMISNVFVESKTLSFVFTFVPIFGMFSLNYVAMELENPFGDDDNDLPLDHFQEEMNSCLMMLLQENADLICTVKVECQKDFGMLKIQLDEAMEAALEEEEPIEVMSPVGSDGGADKMRSKSLRSGRSFVVENSVRSSRKSMRASGNSSTSSGMSSDPDEANRRLSSGSGFNSEKGKEPSPSPSVPLSREDTRQTEPQAAEIPVQAEAEAGKDAEPAPVVEVDLKHTVDKLPKVVGFQDGQVEQKVSSQPQARGAMKGDKIQPEPNSSGSSPGGASPRPCGLAAAADGPSGGESPNGWSPDEQAQEETGWSSITNMGPDIKEKCIQPVVVGTFLIEDSPPLPRGLVEASI
jgi:hypothetical protein